MLFVFIAEIENFQIELLLFPSIIHLLLEITNCDEISRDKFFQERLENEPKVC
jgi:hypothetical protein